MSRHIQKAVRISRASAKSFAKLLGSLEPCCGKMNDGGFKRRRKREIRRWDGDRSKMSPEAF